MEIEKIEIKLSELHEAQKEVIESAKRFNVLCCGRRWGKSELAVDILCNTSLEGFPVGYFTPTYKLLDGTYNECINVLDPLIQRRNEHQFIELANGGRIEFWSLENELAGRSRKYKTVILDECAFAKNLWKTWTESIRATLTDLKGDAWFLSTPKGKNDFFKLFMRGKSEEPNWASWQKSTYTNPFIEKDEIDDAKRDLPQAAFSQEYLAEFLENTANPFGIAFINQCTYPLSTEPPVCFGIDLAKSVDFTVIIGMDRNASVCYFERFQSDWGQVTRKILNLPNVPLAVDASGVGDPIAEDLARQRDEVEAFKFTSTTKQQIMEGLAKGIQERKMTFPEGMITEELSYFEYIYGKMGVKYSAPPGLHDDCVISLALCWHKWKTASIVNTGPSVW